MGEMIELLVMIQTDILIQSILIVLQRQPGRFEDANNNENQTMTEKNLQTDPTWNEKNAWNPGACDDSSSEEVNKEPHNTTTSNPSYDPSYNPKTDNCATLNLHPNENDLKKGAM